MRRATLALASALVLASAHPSGDGAQEPTFRAAVDVVTIDAFAHHDQKPIEGLTAADFIVRDNGVEQAIDALGTTDSAHVIIGLDLSGSVDGETLGRLRAAVRAVTRQLTAQDRVSVFTFADRLRVLARAAIPGTAPDTELEAMRARGSTTLHDALVLGSALARADARPGVFLLFTDGQDTASWTTAGRTLEVLRRTNVVVFPVGSGLPRAVITSSLSLYFDPQAWVAPTAGDTLLFLRQIAETTGGEFLHVNRGERLATTFAAILGRYRQRYLLSYTPTGVTSTDGWHRLEVRLRNRPGSVVAREGYMAR